MRSRAGGTPPRAGRAERSGRGSRTARLVAGALAVLALGGYVTLDALDVVPGVLTSDLGHEDGPAAAATPAPGAAGTPTPATIPGPPGVTPPLPAAGETGPRPTPAGLRRALAARVADPALGRSVGVQVRDASGAVLYSHHEGSPRVPASTTKVLTAVGLAQAVDLGAARFSTRTVLAAPGSAKAPATVALVAGGDNLLAADRGDPGVVLGHAGLGDLARATAAALAADARAGGRAPGPVRVVLDDSVARGPALAPGWAPGDVAIGLTGPVAMLGLAEDRAVPYRPATNDPALHATAAFAVALGRAGVTVTGRPARAQAPAAATELARVESAPVGDVLAVALDDSDNDLTESVARWACARGGAPTTFAGCASWVRDRVGDAGLDVSRVRLADTSGLSAGTRAPVSVIAGAVALGASGKSPGLAGVLARLPVAGLSGTLDERFFEPAARAGVGVVRAKTGTLTGVGALAGSVVDADGRLLTFAVVADAVPATGTGAARAALDSLAATLAACGCR